MSASYINDRFLPDKAIDLMDEAGAVVQFLQPSKVAMQENNTSAAMAAVVTAETVATVLAKWTGIPAQKLTSDESAKLLDLVRCVSLAWLS